MNASLSLKSSSDRPYDVYKNPDGRSHRPALVIHDVTRQRLLFTPSVALEEKGLVLRARRRPLQRDIETQALRSTERFVREHLVGNITSVDYIRRRNIRDQAGIKMHIHGVVAAVRAFETSASLPTLSGPSDKEFLLNAGGFLKFFDTMLSVAGPT